MHVAQLFGSFGIGYSKCIFLQLKLCGSPFCIIMLLCIFLLGRTEWNVSNSTCTQWIELLYVGLYFWILYMQVYWYSEHFLLAFEVVIVWGISSKIDISTCKLDIIFSNTYKITALNQSLSNNLENSGKMVITNWYEPYTKLYAEILLWYRKSII